MLCLGYALGHDTPNAYNIARSAEEQRVIRQADVVSLTNVAKAITKWIFEPSFRKL